MLSIAKMLCSPTGGSGFHAPPPSSRPPTKAYDRQSFVLCVDESDEILKFMKMHLNRYFSHVVVAKTAAEGINYLKQKEFDLVIIDTAPARKSNGDFLKKLVANWRGIPVVLTENEGVSNLSADDFPPLLVIGVVRKPFDLDTFHIAIRRALNIRTALKELDSLVPMKIALGEAIRKAPLSALQDRTRALVSEIRTRLTEEIID